MVDYTGSEKILLNACLGFYKSAVSPDMPIDRTNKDIIIAALDYGHAGGKLIQDAAQHDTMNAILGKNGVEIESNEHRQLRLKKERLAKIRDLNLKTIQSEVTEKEEELKEVKNKAKIQEKKIKDAAKQEKFVSTKEANAKKAQEEAEAKAKTAEEEMEAMKKKMAEMEAQLKSGNKKKKAEPELTKEPPKAIIEPESPKEEKTIDELIDTLK